MDAQADLHLCCSHMAKTGFLMTWLNSWFTVGYHTTYRSSKSAAIKTLHITEDEVLPGSRGDKLPST